MLKVKDGRRLARIPKRVKSPEGGYAESGFVEIPEREMLWRRLRAGQQILGGQAALEPGASVPLEYPDYSLMLAITNLANTPTAVRWVYNPETDQMYVWSRWGGSEGPAMELEGRPAEFHSGLPKQDASDTFVVSWAEPKPPKKDDDPKEK